MQSINEIKITFNAAASCPYGVRKDFNCSPPREFPCHDSSWVWQMAALPALILTLGHEGSATDSLEAMLIINTACTSTCTCFIVVGYR